jgi:hypothetical protein
MYKNLTDLDTVFLSYCFSHEKKEIINLKGKFINTCSFKINFNLAPVSGSSTSNESGCRLGYRNPVHYCLKISC